LPHVLESETPRAGKLPRLGGRLCLDFINTVNSWRDPADFDRYLIQDDVLTDYKQIVYWARSVEVATETEAQTLFRLADEYPEDAAAIHERTLTFRNALHRLLTDYIHGREADPESMAIINFEIADTFSQSRLWWYDQKFTLESLSYDTEAQEQLDEFLEPVVHSAIELLTSPAELKRVRECPGEDCGWLFYDSSGRRRWCSMEDCGNAAKVRRFRERQKSATS
jgi:predicted RNA-binding Zn ribbon-like protein